MNLFFLLGVGGFNSKTWQPNEVLKTAAGEQFYLVDALQCFMTIPAVSAKRVYIIIGITLKNLDIIS